MKRTLKKSIQDNWYSDQYPTFCDYAAHKAQQWEYRNFGNLFGFRYSYHVTRFFRVFELFFYRREQLDYWS